MPTPAENSAPQWTPTARELDDLELLAIGALSPLDRFLGPADLQAVRDRGTLADGTPWRAQVTLAVAEPVADAARQAGRLDLTDPEGFPLATVAVEDTWPVAPGQQGVAGKVSPLATPEFGPFRRLYRTPEQVRQQYAHRRTIATPVTAPLTDEDIAVIRQAAEHTAAVPVLLCCVGAGSPRDVSVPGLIRATLAAADLIGHDATVVAVPVATRGDEAADNWLRAQVAKVFCDDVLFVGTGLGDLPAEIGRIVAQERPPLALRGIVVFFTGLSGSGKSTLARALNDVILEQGARTVTLLDGDVVRRHLSAGLGFSPEDRETNIRRIGFVAAEIARHGGMAICSPIAPYAATRQEVRQMVEDAGGAFVLVHVATPLEECERRDRKGLYARARAGLIPDFTGISAPYEVPDDAAVRVDTTGRSVHDALEEVMLVLRDRGFVIGEE